MGEITRGLKYLMFPAVVATCLLVALVMFIGHVAVELILCIGATWGMIKEMYKEEDAL
jgi:fucose permease